MPVYTKGDKIGVVEMHTRGGEISRFFVVPQFDATPGDFMVPRFKYAGCNFLLDNRGT